MNGVRTAGTVSLFVIPAHFADSPPSPITRSDLQRRLFDGPSDVGTLPEYFGEVSGGRFRLIGTVAPWVRTSVLMDDVRTGRRGTEGPSAQSDHVIQAIREVDAMVDFGRFDNDGPDGKPNSGDDDGFVDGGVLVLMAETMGPCTPSGPIWPQIASLNYPAAADGFFRSSDNSPAGRRIGIRSYVIQSASTCTLAEPTGINVTAHELMHLFFQVPEGYSISGKSSSVPGDGRWWHTGCWDLMAAGSGWGCGTVHDGTMNVATRPVHMSPWAKERVHWLETDTIGEVTDTIITLKPAAIGGSTIRLLIKPGEYFEIEYRQQIGFDERIPASGLLIYRVNLSRPALSGCGAFCEKPVTLIEADNNAGLLRSLSDGGNRGEAGDAFGIGERRSFTSLTTPAAVADDGSPVALAIQDIQIDVNARLARFRLSWNTSVRNVLYR